MSGDDMITGIHLIARDPRMAVAILKPVRSLVSSACCLWFGVEVERGRAVSNLRESLDVAPRGYKEADSPQMPASWATVAAFAKCNSFTAETSLG